MYFSAFRDLTVVAALFTQRPLGKLNWSWKSVCNTLLTVAPIIAHMENLKRPRTAPTSPARASSAKWEKRLLFSFVFLPSVRKRALHFTGRAWMGDEDAHRRRKPRLGLQ